MKLYSRLLLISLYVPWAQVACAQSPAMPATVEQTRVLQDGSEGYIEAPLTRAQVDQLLAPIALYPDTVLSHILIASTYPLEVIHANRWVQENKHLDAEAAREAVEYKDWDPSVKALVAFPELLSRMSDDLEWTEALGEAFLADEAMVMDAIQSLRQHAYDRGSLEKMQHLRVERVEKTIVIEPAVERVVYIPYYDTRVVYGPWWWSDYPPVYWHYPANHVYLGGYHWGPRASLGSSFFFASFHWPQRRVVHIHHHQHPRSFHTARRIATYEGAQHWRHDPVHRRGVAYRHKVVRQRFDHHPQYLRKHTARERLEERRRDERSGRYPPGTERKADRTVFRSNPGDRPPRKADAVITERRQEDKDRIRRTVDRSELREHRERRDNPPESRKADRGDAPAQKRAVVTAAPEAGQQTPPARRELREAEVRERFQRRDAGDGKQLRTMPSRPESRPTPVERPRVEPVTRPERPAPVIERPAPHADTPAPRPERPVTRIERHEPRVERPEPRTERREMRVERPAPRAERPAPRRDVQDRGSSVRFNRPSREER